MPNAKKKKADGAPDKGKRGVIRGRKATGPHPANNKKRDG